VEKREREALEREARLREALAQTAARAVAAEECLRERAVTLEAEFVQKLDLMTQVREADTRRGLWRR